MANKILVVDDEPHLQSLFLQYFRRSIRTGALEFAFASDGVDALHKLADDDDISVVLTDLNMPNMDGLTLLSEIEKLQSSTKAVVMSAYDDMTNIRTAMNRGAFDFLTKPVDFQDVEITIGKTLSLVKQLELSRQAEKHRLAKETAEENYAKLMDLENLRDSLIHMVVHDLRTPLTSFLLGLHSMEDVGELNEMQHECLEISLSGGEALLGMINDLLEISKMESGSPQLDRTSLEIGALVALCLREVASLAEQKSLIIKSDLAAELPPVHANEEKLRRTLINLLGNAIKFTPSAGQVTVAVALDGTSGALLFSVSDTGEGIPSEALERIFDKFAQVESRNAGRLMSTGLGLTFCKLAVEAHGGRIWVESTLGQGSHFKFIIPSMVETKSD